MNIESKRGAAGPALMAWMLVVVGGCAVEAMDDGAVVVDVEQGDVLTLPEPLPRISADLAFSPQPGDRYEGGLEAQVPLFGVTNTPDDDVRVYVFDHSVHEYVELARTRTTEAPMEMGGRPVYGYDFGMACLVDCDVSMPLHAWAGFGPFVAHFHVWSAAQGWLDLAGECREGDGVEPCAAANPDPLRVEAHPGGHGAGH